MQTIWSKRRPQLVDALDRKLVDLEVVEVVLALERLGAAHAGRAEVDAGHPRRGPAQGVLGRLRCSAAGDQDGEVFPVGSAPARTDDSRRGAAVGPARAVDSVPGYRRAADRDTARRSRGPLGDAMASCERWSVPSSIDVTRVASSRRTRRPPWLAEADFSLWLRPHLPHHRVEVERRRFLARRELHEVLDLRRHQRLHQVQLWRRD